MDTGDIKKLLQGHFSDGLAVIVGSGLSAAEGISGMGPLAAHLLAEVGKGVTGLSDAIWTKIAADLGNGVDLESALHNNAPDDALDTLIRHETASFLIPQERKVLNDVVQGKRTLRLSRILPYLTRPTAGIPFITTNYDRLVEAALELGNFHVDGLYVGDLAGRFDPAKSWLRSCQGVKMVRKTPQLIHAKRATVLKPHGSFDWFQGSGGVIRSPLDLDVPRLIVTPGVGKYRAGYDQPFDVHRERANKEIDKAARFLILGFGFNDPHLQTHLEPQVKRGTPALLLSRSLSASTIKLMPQCPNMIAICHDGTSGSILHYSGVQHKIAEPIWDLEHFVNYTF
jgi:hypothetical protein